MIHRVILRQLPFCTAQLCTADNSGAVILMEDMKVICILALSAYKGLYPVG